MGIFHSSTALGTYSAQVLLSTYITRRIYMHVQTRLCNILPCLRNTEWVIVMCFFLWRTDKVRHKNRKVFAKEVASVYDKLLFICGMVAHHYSSVIYVQGEMIYSMSCRRVIWKGLCMGKKLRCYQIRIIVITHAIVTLKGYLYKYIFLI